MDSSFWPSGARSLAWLKGAGQIVKRITGTETGPAIVRKGEGQGNYFEPYTIVTTSGHALTHNLRAVPIHPSEKER